MAEAAQPKVSIIIPTLNAGALLDNCLASIASQTYPRNRIEIILADAFSKDARAASLLPSRIWALPRSK